MDYRKLRELSSSQRVADSYSLDELIAGARDYKALGDTLESRRLGLEKEMARINGELSRVQAEMRENSFGGLLLNAIGIKLRDDAPAPTSPSSDQSSASP